MARSAVTWLLLLVLVAHSALVLPTVQSFAYAPNFITKIIQEQTAMEPKGLLQIDSTTAVIENDSTTAKNGKQPLAAMLEEKKEPELPMFSKKAKKSPLVRLVRTRFPPEPNGYLHLGHAKAVSFNFAVARAFNGRCNMRLDDTNPSKEDAEYVESILEDVLWIQDGLYDDTVVPWDGKVRKTSDYFDEIYDCAVALIESGDAYVDSLSADEMRDYRGTLTEPGKDSPYRPRSIQENLQLFRDMKAGKFPDGTLVLRAKIDMASPNINMRDPTLYRIKHESHQETGDQWCIYPMYDFSHPIADAMEGITHSLCTLEFEDHRPFYDWTIEKLQAAGMQHILASHPQQIEFSRLNIQSTVLSKRKLIQLVQEGHVQGWDDPRMPSLSGMRRRGVPPATLRLFCERVGISKADSNIDLTVLEDCIRETMDATCPRAFCVLEPLQVTITNWPDGLEELKADRHPKIPEMGQRTIPFGKSVYIERSDFFDLDGPEGKATNGKAPKGFKRLLPNGTVRLRYAYVIECTDVVRDPVSNEPIELKCKYMPESRAGATPEGMARVNGIVHWVEATSAVKCTINQYDRLFATEEPGKESGDFLKDINKDSLQVLDQAVVEPSVKADAQRVLAQCKASKSDGKKVYPSSLAYQFERSGYFALDSASITSDGLVMNRVVTLRDTWGAKSSDTATAVRNRGGGNTNQRAQPQKSQEPIEDIRRVALRAATIVSAEAHPEADNLLVCKADCGDKSETDDTVELRTIVAGLAGKIPIDGLIGKKVVAITNLKPASMRGIESTAMLLAASDGREGDEEIVELLQVPESVPNGELISFEGKEVSEPDTMMKSKGAIKAFERAKSRLRATGEREAAYLEGSDSFRLMTSGGPVTTSTLSDAIIQ